MANQEFYIASNQNDKKASKSRLIEDLVAAANTIQKPLVMMVPVLSFSLPVGAMLVCTALLRAPDGRVPCAALRLPFSLSFGPVLCPPDFAHVRYSFLITFVPRCAILEFPMLCTPPSPFIMFKL